MLVRVYVVWSLMFVMTCVICLTRWLVGSTVGAQGLRFGDVHGLSYTDHGSAEKPYTLKA